MTVAETPRVKQHASRLPAQEKTGVTPDEDSGTAERRVVRIERRARVWETPTSAWSGESSTRHLAAQIMARLRLKEGLEP